MTVRQRTVKASRLFLDIRDPPGFAGRVFFLPSFWLDFAGSAGLRRGAGQRSAPAILRVVVRIRGRSRGSVGGRGLVMRRQPRPRRMPFQLQSRGSRGGDMAQRACREPFAPLAERVGGQGPGPQAGHRRPSRSDSSRSLGLRQERASPSDFPAATPLRENCPRFASASTGLPTLTAGASASVPMAWSCMAPAPRRTKNRRLALPLSG